MPETTTIIMLAFASIMLIIISSWCYNAYKLKLSNDNNNNGSQVLALKNNDKIIVIKGAGYDDIENAVQQFSLKYDIDAATLRINKVAVSATTITFPFDIAFDRFCFLVNYLYYPEHIIYSADIKAWAMLSKVDEWADVQLAGKKIMIYIPPDDKEYDNVFMTTTDNEGYKMTFSESRPSPLSAGNFPLYQQQGQL